MSKNFNTVSAQYTPPIKNVTAGVRVGGGLGSILVYCNPINYTLGSWGINPGVSTSPKINNCGRNDIMIDLDPTNNVKWDIFINATDMVDGAGHSIPVNNIYVNSTCGGGTGISLTSLQYYLQTICTNIPYDNWANVSFYMNVPAGQYNNTYYGNITIYINSTGVEMEPRNRTWFGLKNTTVKIEKFIDIAWGGVPVDFGTVGPGAKKNATDAEHGWPSNITSSALTNIFVELYLNGTDFVNKTSASPWNPSYCSGGICLFESDNVTYSNATTLLSWPDRIISLSNTFYPSPGGDFWNWGKTNFGNKTTKNITWNISIPNGMPAADYYANVNAKAVDVGEVP
jgi:hypothetical protein